MSTNTILSWSIMATNLILVWLKVIVRTKTLILKEITILAGWIAYKKLFK